MHRYRKGIMQACLQMRTFLYLYRAQARSEKERSGFELGMTKKAIGRKPAARRPIGRRLGAQAQMKEGNDG